MNSKVAKGLKVERIKKSLKVRDVAKKLGVCDETIRRYEKGSREISFNLLEKLLSIYGTNLSAFFTNICTGFYD